LPGRQIVANDDGDLGVEVGDRHQDDSEAQRWERAGTRPFV
jgi:hypothetical protein